MNATGQLDRYREVRSLGVGGMGEVVLAEDSVLGREVALKRLRGSGDRGELGRLRREALAGASFSHPNLVAVYDALLEDEELVIVMEYVEGQTLHAALARGPLPPRRALDIVTATAAALDHIHGRGVVHRDVKPANILLGLRGAVKLGDLGIASVADRTRITSAGTVLGTIPYMAPEQLETSAPTPAVDIYALGAVAFEALCGRRARNETNPLALAHALATQPPPDLREVWPGAPGDAAAVLAMAMARDPSARPRSAGEFAARLRAALTRSEPTAPARRLSPRVAAAAPAERRPAAAPARARPTPPSPSTPRIAARRPGLLAALALGAAALAIVVAVLLAGGGGRSNPPPSQVAGAAAQHRVTAPKRAVAAAPAPAAPGGTGVPGAATGGPVGAVESFYQLAAAHKYASAWALADPAFRAQLLGFRAFSAQQSAVRSIVFNSATVVSQQGKSASVAVRTTPTLDSGVQHCGGTVQTVNDAGRWLLDHIAITC